MRIATIALLLAGTSVAQDYKPNDPRAVTQMLHAVSNPFIAEKLGLSEDEHKQLRQSRREIDRMWSKRIGGVLETKDSVEPRKLQANLDVVREAQRDVHARILREYVGADRMNRLRQLSIRYHGRFRGYHKLLTSTPVAYELDTMWKGIPEGIKKIEKQLEVDARGIKGDSLKQEEATWRLHDEAVEKIIGLMNLPEQKAKAREIFGEPVIQDGDAR